MSTTRTADQTAAAKFWASAPIWNTWNQVAQNLAVTRHTRLDHEAGQLLGAQVAGFVLDRLATAPADSG